MDMENRSLADIQALEDAYQLKTYSKYPLAVSSGSGVWVTASDGKRYLDLYGGHAVAITGHCHPKVVAAVSAQASKLLFYSNVVYHETRALAAQAIVNFAPAGLGKVFFCNSGAEANETAIKLARKFTGRTTIIAMNRGFHGRTCGAMSITETAKYRLFPPFMPGVEFAEFGDLRSILDIIEKSKGNIAGIILEPVQSMAGVRMAPPEYYRTLRQICSDHGIVLVFDEVQTGFGRCGTNFFGDSIGVTPDLITCAKGVASGIPIGCVIVKDEIAATVKLGEHGATFGGSPVACAAALATIQVIIEENLAQNAKEVGAYVAQQILAAGVSHLTNVKGIGLLIGLEFDVEAKELVTQMLKAKIIIGGSDDPKVLRLLPPLTLSRSECDLFVSELVQASKIFN